VGTRSNLILVTSVFSMTSDVTQPKCADDPTRTLTVYRVMPTFIDESGDTGHARDSKPYFRVAAVWVPTAEAANKFREAVRTIRTSGNLRCDYEFKYFSTHHHPERREAFFRAAIECQFRFVVACVDKTSVRWRGASKDDYFYATTMYLAVTLTSKPNTRRPGVGRNRC
jgi:hypothetical protein